MAGPLQGIASGLEAGLRLNALSEERGIEQQRVGLEAQRLGEQQKMEDTALARQQHQDALTAAQTQLTDTAHAAMPYRQILANVPQDATAAEVYCNSAPYKAAITKVKEFNDTASDLADTRNEHLSALAGHVIQTARQKAKQTSYRLATEGPANIPAGDIADAITLHGQQPPTAWIKDPKTGQSPMDAAHASLGEAIQTGNWDNAGDSIAALMPELHLAVGAKTPEGGTVTGAGLNSVHYDPKDHNYLLVSHTLEHTAPDGTVTHQNTPAMGEGSVRVPVQTLVDRFQKSRAMAQAVDHPEIQSKLQEAMDTGTTMMHNFDQTMDEAGVPRSERLPAPYQVKTTGQGGYLVTGPDGLPIPSLGKNPRATGASQIQSFVDTINDPNSTDEERQDANDRLADFESARKGRAGPDVRGTEDDQTANRTNRVQVKATKSGGAANPKVVNRVVPDPDDPTKKITESGTVNANGEFEPLQSAAEKTAAAQPKTAWDSIPAAKRNKAQEIVDKVKGGQLTREQAHKQLKLLGVNLSGG